MACLFRPYLSLYIIKRSSVLYVWCFMFKKNVDIRYIIVLLFVSLSLEYSLVEVAWMITKFLFDFLKN